MDLVFLLINNFRQSIISILLLLCLGFTSCVPTVDYRGYIAKDKEIQKIKPGMGKAEVEALLGSPSTTATVTSEGDSYYYISSVIKKSAFFKPEIVDREILAIRFDRDDRVSHFANYGLKDGKVIDFITRETPTKGRELSILQQMFNNIGRYSPSGGKK